MMTMNWAEKRVQWLGAILLAAIAGCVDGYGLLSLKTYVLFMNGNTTSTGVARAVQLSLSGDSSFRVSAAILKES